LLYAAPIEPIEPIEPSAPTEPSEPVAEPSRDLGSPPHVRR
jgi:hypothetical protein